MAEVKDNINGDASVSYIHRNLPANPETTSRPTKIPYIQLLFNLAYINDHIASHGYKGSGTDEDPYLVEWLDDDPRNPMRFPDGVKWCWTMLVAITTLSTAIATSAYSAPANEVMRDLLIGQEVFELGLSMFVLGLALGPLLWAPLSEMYGRQIIFTITYAIFTLFNVAVAVAPNIEGLVILRFFAAAFGSSTFTNSGGVVADIWPDHQRGLGLIAFSAAPFFGPILGPVYGGFLAEAAGWRWVMGLLAIVSGIVWIIVSLVVPETYAPLLLRKRASALSRATGKIYISKLDKGKPKKNLGALIRVALTRPWVMLIREPIVLLLSIYMALLYGILYMFFAAFPIVYQHGRGWSESIGGLSFLGIGIGIIPGLLYMFPDNAHYQKRTRHLGTRPDPEIRLLPAMVGCIAIPISLFWFAWTNGRAVHWIVSLIAQVPFGFGFVLVYMSVQAYLVDAYTVYAASVLAANVLLRSGMGAAFPLFTGYMYEGLGIHWASSVPAFLSLVYVPIPFLFYRYGAKVRAKCRFAAEAKRHLEEIRGEKAR